MENKIKRVNAVFDKYDPCHVVPKANTHAIDEYYNASVRFVHIAQSAGIKSALDDALEILLGKSKHLVDYNAMLKDLTHAV